ncbi:MAG: bacteriohemerythrin [Lachnospiraceae bacterium]|nr:bacteriohemerythrin [Lachnospiraceae bacterium]
MYRFTEDCLTGIQQIDEEHKKLFALLNTTLELLQNEVLQDKYHQVQDILEELKQYADIHFVNEEAYMAAINDPELEIQKEQHMAFREKINHMDFSDIAELEAQHETLEDLMRYLTRWLYQHILGSDILIGKMPPREQWKNQENPCVFTEKYLTGIELIDGEHKTLFEIIGEANDLVKAELLHDKYDEIVNILTRLRDYTKEHFADEEEYMESINYPGIGAQKMAHKIFVSKLEEIDLQHVDDHQQEYLEELLEFLFGWLSNHILKMDKMIGK